MLDAVSGRNSLLTFAFTARLEPSRPLTAEEIGNVIEAMVDDLDPKVIDPPVSATGCETAAEVEVAATLDPRPG